METVKDENMKTGRYEFNKIYWDEDHWYSIGFLSDVLGVKQSVLRMYIKRGWLKAEKRTWDSMTKDGKHIKRCRQMVKSHDLADFLRAFYANFHEMVETADKALTFAKIT